MKKKTSNIVLILLNFLIITICFHKHCFAENASDVNKHENLNQSTGSFLCDPNIFPWTRQLHHGSRSDEGTRIKTDSCGNVYVAGNSDSTASFNNIDFIIIKYGPNGDTLWIRKYNGIDTTNIREDYVSDMTIDAAGNVYVTGRSMNKYGNFDYATVKYNSNGVQQWVQRYNGTGNSSDYVSSVVVDSFGNVYVAGYSFGIGTGYDYVTIKYNSNGVQQWVQRYNGHGNGNEGVNSLALDSQGNVYVTGGCDLNGGIGKEDTDYLTIKYSQTEGITAPSNLEAQSIDSSFIKVTWQDNSNDEDGFYIERTQINDSSHWEVIDAVPQNVNHYEDYFVTRNLKYYYRVNAYSGNIFSGYSNTDSAILG
mgnify:CR=1 FL=1